MTFSLLQITNGTQRINLLSKQHGFMLKQWIPTLAQPKDGGVWSSSPLEDGRRPIMKTMDNITDGFLLSLTAPDVDDAIEELQDLRSLLDQAVGYWLNDIATNPVWIEACGVGETSKRYAIIYDYRTPQDPDSYSDPFAKMTSSRSMIPEFLLIVEHGMWSDSQPKTGNSLPLEGLSPHIAWNTGILTIPISSGADDISYLEERGIAYVAETSFYIGVKTGSRGAAFRFSSVSVPVGSYITSAYISFKSAETLSGLMRIIFSGEKTPYPGALLGTFADIQSRARTEKVVRLETSASWTLNSRYNSADLTHVLQELIDQDGWVTGNPVVIFVEDTRNEAIASSYGRRIYGYESAAADAAILYIRYANGLGVPGLSKTSARKIFVANQHSRSQLSHIFNYDVSLASYSSNLLGIALPYLLFPADADQFDRVYFGSCDITTPNSHFAGSGPFCNIVFDVNVVNPNYTSFRADYWNGAWYQLFTRDNTKERSNDSFSLYGVVSIHWEFPPDWVTTTVNGVVGWWIRIELTTGDTPPVLQQNRHPYSVVIPYVSIDGNDVICDIPPSAKIGIQNPSSSAFDTGSYAQPYTYTNRILMASRSLSRGKYFTPFLNASDKQNDPAVSIYIPMVSSSAYANNSRVCSGRVIQTVWGSPGGMGIQFYYFLADHISREYFGTYRVFLRGIQDSGTPGDVGVYVKVAFGEVLGAAAIYTSPTVYTATMEDSELLDLGQMSILNVYGNNIGDAISIGVWMSSKAALTFRTYDLILFPIDEYIGDFIDSNPDPTVGSIGGTGRYRKQLDVDSISNPKTLISSVVSLKHSGFGYTANPNASNDSIFAVYSAIQSGRAYIQKKADQRLWFLTSRMHPSTHNWISDPESVCSVDMSIAKHYFSMRGKI